MHYIKIKASFIEDEKRLYRKLYVRSDISLYELGCVLVEAFYGTFSHYFYFEDEKRLYYPKCFLNELGEENAVLMSNHNLFDVTFPLKFFYDTGEGYEFNITQDGAEYFDTRYNVKDQTLAFFIDGKGLGIFEDDITTLRAYLDGEIDVNDDLETSDIFRLPWNMIMGKISEFDEPLKFVEVQGRINHTLTSKRILNRNDCEYE